MLWHVTNSLDNIQYMYIKSYSKNNIVEHLNSNSDYLSNSDKYLNKHKEYTGITRKSLVIQQFNYQNMLQLPQKKYINKLFFKKQCKKIFKIYKFHLKIFTRKWILRREWVSHLIRITRSTSFKVYYRRGKKLYNFFASYSLNSKGINLNKFLLFTYNIDKDIQNDYVKFNSIFKFIFKKKNRKKIEKKSSNTFVKKTITRLNNFIETKVLWNYKSSDSWSRLKTLKKIKKKINTIKNYLKKKNRNKKKKLLRLITTLGYRKLLRIKKNNIKPQFFKNPNYNIKKKKTPYSNFITLKGNGNLKKKKLKNLLKRKNLIILNKNIALDIILKFSKIDSILYFAKFIEDKDAVIKKQKKASIFFKNNYNSILNNFFFNYLTFLKNKQKKNFFYNDNQKLNSNTALKYKFQYIKGTNLPLLLKKNKTKVKRSLFFGKFKNVRAHKFFKNIKKFYFYEEIKDYLKKTNVKSKLNRRTKSRIIRNNLPLWKLILYTKWAKSYKIKMGFKNTSKGGLNFQEKKYDNYVIKSVNKKLKIKNIKKINKIKKYSNRFKKILKKSKFLSKNKKTLIFLFLQKKHNNINRKYCQIKYFLKYYKKHQSRLILKKKKNLIFFNSTKLFLVNSYKNKKLKVNLINNLEKINLHKHLEKLDDSQNYDKKFKNNIDTFVEYDFYCQKEIIKKIYYNFFKKFLCIKNYTKNILKIKIKKKIKMIKWLKLKIKQNRLNKNKKLKVKNSIKLIKVSTPKISKEKKNTNTSNQGYNKKKNTTKFTNNSKKNNNKLNNKKFQVQTTLYDTKKIKNHKRIHPKQQKKYQNNLKIDFSKINQNNNLKSFKAKINSNYIKNSKVVIHSENTLNKNKRQKKKNLKKKNDMFTLLRQEMRINKHRSRKIINKSDRVKKNKRLLYLIRGILGKLKNKQIIKTFAKNFDKVVNTIYKNTINKKYIIKKKNKLKLKKNKIIFKSGINRVRKSRFLRWVVKKKYKFLFKENPKTSLSLKVLKKKIKLLFNKQYLKLSRKQINSVKSRLFIQKLVRILKTKFYKKNFFITYKKTILNSIVNRINKSKKISKKNYKLKKLLCVISNNKLHRLLFWYRYNLNLVTKIQNQKDIYYKKSNLNTLHKYIFKHVLQQRKKKFFIQYGNFLLHKKTTFYKKTKYLSFELRKKKIYYKKLQFQLDEPQHLSLVLTKMFITSLTTSKTYNSNINQFMWLNNKSYENYLLYFFSNEESDDTELINLSNKTFFFNFKNKKLKVYKLARQTHWGAFTNKSINKRRYQIFLDNFLQKSKHFFTTLFTIFIFKFKLSFNFWKNFSNFYTSLYNIVLNKKQIFQIPIHQTFWKFIHNYELSKVKIDQKITLWQNTQAHIKKTFWMQQKRNIPKFLKKKQLNFNGIENCIQYDFLTNYFCIIKQFNQNTFNNDFIFKNKYLKLHGFKYNS